MQFAAKCVKFQPILNAIQGGEGCLMFCKTGLLVQAFTGVSYYYDICAIVKFAILISPLSTHVFNQAGELNTASLISNQIWRQNKSDKMKIELRVYDLWKVAFSNKFEPRFELQRSECLGNFAIRKLRMQGFLPSSTCPWHAMLKAK